MDTNFKVNQPWILIKSGWLSADSFQSPLFSPQFYCFLIRFYFRSLCENQNLGTYRWNPGDVSLFLRIFHHKLHGKHSPYSIPNFCIGLYFYRALPLKRSEMLSIIAVICWKDSNENLFWEYVWNINIQYGKYHDVVFKYIRRKRMPTALNLYFPLGVNCIYKKAIDRIKNNVCHSSGFCCIAFDYISISMVDLCFQGI